MNHWKNKAVLKRVFYGEVNGMKYKVQFTRYFEEFDLYDCDTKEFDNLKEANEFFNSVSDDDENKKLFAGKDRIR